MGKTKRIQHMFVLSELLRGRGYDCYVEENTHLYANGPLINIRADQQRGVLEIGFSRTFDRWANSVDMVFRDPAWWDETELSQMIDEAEEAANNVRASKRARG